MIALALILSSIVPSHFPWEITVKAENSGETQVYRYTKDYTLILDTYGCSFHNTEMQGAQSVFSAEVSQITCGPLDKYGKIDSKHTFGVMATPCIKSNHKTNDTGLEMLLDGEIDLVLDGRKIALKCKR